MFQGDTFHLIVINVAGIFVHVVSQRIEHHAGEVYGASVGKVAAVVEIHSEECVARFEHGLEHCHIGLCPGVRLHVGIFGIKNLFQAVDSKVLGLVNNLASAVIAVARIAFGILVGEA